MKNLLYALGIFISILSYTVKAQTTNFNLKLLVDGVQLKELNSENNKDLSDSELPVLELKIGKKLQFKVSSEQAHRPYISGLPMVWEAAFAGDIMFHCDPNFAPLSITPFIGLDSRVHTLMLRPFPENFKLFEDDWLATGDNNRHVYDWTYTIQREMNPNLRYSANNYYDWPKKHKSKSTGAYISQRQNQKEGLNMKFLYHWNDWERSKFYGNYDGQAKYMMGFDDDELAYFNHPFIETNDKHPIQNNAGGVAKLEKLQWKEVLEGEALRDPYSYYPTQGHPLNIMVNAFRRHQATKSSLLTVPYHGYEIQDVGTSELHPSGTGQSLPHPGIVTVTYGNAQIRFKLRVPKPYEGYEGFYSSLIGPENPSIAEQEVAYYLKGLEDESIFEQEKYKITYKWMNRLGQIKEKSYTMLDRTSSFNLERPAYSWVTATYKPNSESDPIIIAGKELKQRFIIFCGVKTLNGQKFPEGKGHGAYIWLEDFRRSKDVGRGYVEKREFGNDLVKYSQRHFKTYNFKVGDEVTFTTYDGDPHVFDNDDEEWYLSNKAIAKRIKGDSLYNAVNPEKSFLKYYIGPFSNGLDGLVEVRNLREGKDMTYTFNTPGEYQMRVAYRGTSDLFIKINVENKNPVAGYNDKFPEIGESQAKIIERDLLGDEERWLGVKSGDYKVYEVEDIDTEFAFKKGYRSYVGKPEGNKLANRWEKNNDFAEIFSWKLVDTTSQSSTSTVQSIFVKNLIINRAINKQVKDFLSTYESDINDRSKTWLWKDWANHYSSVWKGKLKIGNLDGLPPYTPNSTVRRLYSLPDLDTAYKSYIDTEIFAEGKYENQKKAPWQFVIPLVSTTEYHGIRQRTNPSCIYNLNKVFDVNTGAFSGSPFNPDRLKPEDIQAPDVSDEIKNKQEFYFKLKNKKLIVSRQLLGKTVRVYNSFREVLGKTNYDDLPMAERAFGSSSESESGSERTGSYNIAHSTLHSHVLESTGATLSTGAKVGIGLGVVGAGGIGGALIYNFRRLIKRKCSSSFSRVISRNSGYRQLEENIPLGDF